MAAVPQPSQGWDARFTAYTDGTKTWIVEERTGKTVFESNDASAVIQYGIDQDGGCIHITQGTYVVSNLQVMDDTCLIGDGPGRTILKAAPNTINLPVISSVRNGHYSDPVEDVTIMDLEIDGSDMGTGKYSIGDKGIGGGYWKGTHFENLYIHDTPATCMGPDYPIDVVITDVIVANCGKEGWAAGSNGFGIGTGAFPNESIIITRSRSINVSNSGFLVEELASNATSNRQYVFENNISIGDRKGFSVSGADNTIIRNNGVWYSDTDGIRAIKFVVHVPENVTIIDNTVVNAGAEGIYIDTAIKDFQIHRNNVYGSERNGVVIRGNTGELMNNVIEGNGAHGIFLGAAVNGTVVSDVLLLSNTIFDNGRLTPQFSDGITLNSANNEISNIIIIKNKVYNNNTEQSQRYGISMSVGKTMTGIMIADNMLENNRVADIYNPLSSGVTLVNN